jgi:hypothetical protein
MQVMELAAPGASSLDMMFRFLELMDSFCMGLNAVHL